MKWLSTYLLTFLLLVQAPFSYAFDWKEIHEKADIITPAVALVNVEENPDSLDSLYLLGLVYLNEYRNNEAEKVFEKMLSQDPNIWEAQWGLAEVFRRQRKLDKSEKILDDVIESNPGFSPAYISLAYLKYVQRDFKASIKLAREVIDQGKDNVDLTNFVRAYCLVAGGQGMLAHYGGPLAKLAHGTRVLPNLKKAEELQPDSPAVLFGLGSYYLLIPKVLGRDIDKAEQYLLRAIAIDQNFPDAYVRLAQVYQAKGDSGKYKMYLNKALALDPENELALDALQGKCAFACFSVEK